MYRQAKVMSNPDQALESVIAELARLPLVHQPGTKWNYSMSIDVLGHLIEVISEKPLQDFLQERLFAPLGMTDTGFAVSRDKRHRIAAMYGHPDIAVSTLSQIAEAWQKGQNERRDVESTNPSSNTLNFARGGYGLLSTASDYMRFAQMLLNRGTLDGVRIIAPKTVDFMHMNHLPAALIPYDIGPITFPGYGFGLGSRVLMNVAESGMPGSVGEFGWAGAAKTYYWIDPQDQLIGILLSQYMVCFDLPEKDLQVLTYQAVME